SILHLHASEMVEEAANAALRPGTASYFGATVPPLSRERRFMFGQNSGSPTLDCERSVVAGRLTGCFARGGGMPRDGVMSVNISGVVLSVDDNQSFAHLIPRWLAADPDLHHAAHLPTTCVLLEFVALLHPTVVVLDLRM